MHPIRSRYNVIVLHQLIIDAHHLFLSFIILFFIKWRNSRVNILPIFAHCGYNKYFFSTWQHTLWHFLFKLILIIVKLKYNISKWTSHNVWKSAKYLLSICISCNCCAYMCIVQLCIPKQAFWFLFRNLIKSKFSILI